jgi:hypothetical protein
VHLPDVHASCRWSGFVDKNGTKEISMPYQQEDKTIFEDLLSPSRWKGMRGKPLNELIILVGKYFLGTPYAANTLETGKKETLVFDLRRFDCFTFVENCIVLARLIEAAKSSFGDYRGQLGKIRYRRGELRGYSSRLHYFSDWLYDNEEKGIVRDVTVEIGGVPVVKEINFMTTHPNDYPALKDGTVFREIQDAEKRLSRQFRYIVPKSGFGQIQDRIEDGNLIGIATDIGGLDIAHVGFAMRTGGHIHLLHASEKEGKVVLSASSLSDYLFETDMRSGIVVARVLPCSPT